MRSNVGEQLKSNIVFNIKITKAEISGCGTMMQTSLFNFCRRLYLYWGLLQGEETAVQ